MPGKPAAGESVATPRLAEGIFDCLLNGQMQFLPRQGIAQRWAADCRKLWPDGTGIDKVISALNTAAAESAKLKPLVAKGPLFKQHAGQQCLSLTNRARTAQKKLRPTAVPVVQSVHPRRPSDLQIDGSRQAGLSGQEIKQMLHDMPDVRYPNYGHGNQGEGSSPPQTRYLGPPSWAEDPRVGAERLPVTLSYPATQVAPVVFIEWRDVFVTKRTKLLEQHVRQCNSPSEHAAVWERHRQAGLWFCMQFFGWGRCRFNENCFFIHADPAAVRENGDTTLCRDDCPHLREECRGSPLTSCPFVHRSELSKLRPPLWWAPPTADGASTVRVVFRSAGAHFHHKIVPVARRMLYRTAGLDELGGDMGEWCSREDCCRWRLCNMLHLAPRWVVEVASTVDSSVRDLVNDYTARCPWFKRAVAVAEAAAQEAAKGTAVTPAAAPKASAPAPPPVPQCISGSLHCEQLTIPMALARALRGAGRQALHKLTEVGVWVVLPEAQQGGVCQARVQALTQKEVAAAAECLEGIITGSHWGDGSARSRGDADDRRLAEKFVLQAVSTYLRQGLTRKSRATEQAEGRTAKVKNAIKELKDQDNEMQERKQKTDEALQRAADELREAQLKVAKLRGLDRPDSPSVAQLAATELLVARRRLEISNLKQALEQVERSLVQNDAECKQLAEREGQQRQRVLDLEQQLALHPIKETKSVEHLRLVETSDLNTAGGEALSERQELLASVRAAVWERWVAELGQQSRLASVRAAESEAEAKRDALAVAVAEEARAVERAQQRPKERARLDRDEEMRRQEDQSTGLLQQKVQLQWQLKQYSQQISQVSTRHQAAINSEPVLRELADDVKGLEEELEVLRSRVRAALQSPWPSVPKEGKQAWEERQLLRRLDGAVEGSLSPPPPALIPSPPRLEEIVHSVPAGRQLCRWSDTDEA
eukprot:Hpha_TRINITY_DN18834_c0_g1::TRINITY_DN18834_c0_g1_i1::g.26169::m.26169